MLLTFLLKSRDLFRQGHANILKSSVLDIGLTYKSTEYVSPFPRKLRQLLEAYLKLS